MIRLLCTILLLLPTVATATTYTDNPMLKGKDVVYYPTTKPGCTLSIYPSPIDSYQRILSSSYSLETPTNTRNATSEYIDEQKKTVNVSAHMRRLQDGREIPVTAHKRRPKNSD